MNPQPVPVGFVCEYAALTRLRAKVDALPLHPHKRAIVRAWIDEEIKLVEAEATKAKEALE